jgi:hypothetical protein
MKETTESTKAERQYLSVPYAEREEAKAAGAKWDAREKLWYIGPEATRAGLAKWLLENAAAAVPIQERIGKYMERVDPAVSGQHGHTATLAAARCLVWDWGLSESEALPYLKVYNERCEPPWSEAELERKLKQALEYKHHKTARGHLVGEGYSPGEDKPVPQREVDPKPVFEPEKLARLASELDEPVDADYLEARSKFTCLEHGVGIRTLCSTWWNTAHPPKPTKYMSPKSRFVNFRRSISSWSVGNIRYWFGIQRASTRRI